MTKARELATFGNVYSDGNYGRRNLIINGAMQVAQRGTSETGVTDAGYYTCDRWQLASSGTIGTHTITQEADGPSGFANSWKTEVTTANASPAVDDFIFFRQFLEGQDLQQIAKGTSDAKQLTLSFWVKSNVTGTYQVNLYDRDNTRLVGATYTVSASGTWEKVEITFPADTTGAFDNDNAASLHVEWWLDSGSAFAGGAVPTSWEAASNPDRNAGSNVNLADTIGNYWQITGVQLELGDTATPFEHRPYGEELALCQRYYEKGRVAENRVIASGDVFGCNVLFKTVKRVSPTTTAAHESSNIGTGSLTQSKISEHGFSLYQTASGTGTASVEYSYTADAEL